MKQYQIKYNEEKEFLEELRKFQQKWNHTPRMVFQIFSDILEADAIEKVGRAIEQVFPDVPWFGCSTGGNLIDCQLVPGITVVVTIFEKESSQFKVFQYDTHDYPTEWLMQKIMENVEAYPWVKAIELFFSFPESSLRKFCEDMQEIDSSIHIFGGIAGNDDMTSNVSCVFSKEGGFSEHALIVVFYGGDEFYVDSIKITGWKPLGKKFCVTKVEGTLLQELDGIPAYDVYNKYFNISNDENFLYNTLEFPLLCECNGITILRVPTASNPDHSITVSADIELGSTVRITYGDPQTIMESIATDSQRIKKFQPDVLHFFSCMARRSFWAYDEPTYELAPFKDIAPSAGFFSLGEFLRADNCLSQHNVTLVVAAMREGEAEESRMQNVSENRASLSKMPLVSRLASFISVASLELEEMNEKLITMAITDGMTGLYKRTETRRRIEHNLAKVNNNNLSLIMMDLDDFKQVNDTYGHQEGDTVILALSDILLKEQKRVSENISAGRWGGEEFMLVLANTDVSTATLIADLIRQCFENTSFPSIPSQTISVGVTQANSKDTFDTLCTRVDTALYQAKKTGKNKVVVL